MAERIITYPLHVNAMQYRYICHEVQRTRQVYLYFRNMILKNYEKVKQHQCQQLLTKDEIAIQLHTYLQKYAPMITWLEEQSMVNDLHILLLKRLHLRIIAVKISRILYIGVI